MEENTAKRKAFTPADGEKSKVAKQDTDDNDDTDDNKDNMPLSTTNTDDSKDTKPDAKSDDDNEEEEFAAPITQFPTDGPRKYILNRAAGDDVLQNMDEHMAEGVLEIDGDSAKFWVKFPEDQGEVAGVEEINTGIGPPTHFKALACKAYIDYGTWSGPIHRDENTVGAGIFGSMMTFGTNVAEAGRDDPHFSPSDPLKIDVIHSLVLKKGETPVPDDEMDNLPEGYEVAKAGSLIFTLFIEDGRSSYGSGRDAPVPVSFWFCPAEESANDSSLKIPDDIMKDIDKLPSIKRG